MLTIGDLASNDQVNEFFVTALGETLAVDQFRVLFIAPLDSGSSYLVQVRIEADIPRDVTCILGQAERQMLLEKGRLMPEALH